MITKENYTAEHIQQLRGNRGRDPILIERMLLIQMAPKVLYMATCLLTGIPFEKATDPNRYRKEKLKQPDVRMLSVIRRTNLEGFEYLVKADSLLSEYRNHSPNAVTSTNFLPNP